jgi:hypothetical protein
MIKDNKFKLGDIVRHTIHQQFAVIVTDPRFTIGVVHVQYQPDLPNSSGFGYWSENFIELVDGDCYNEIKVSNFYINFRKDIQSTSAQRVINKLINTLNNEL